MDADELDWNRTLREQWEFHFLPEVCLLRELYQHTAPQRGETR